MGNRHFGKVSEVLKHGLLAEVLVTDRPAHFAETHAGTASYPLTHSPERDYGLYGFIDRSTDEVLHASAYRNLLLAITNGATYPARCPGSPLVAMQFSDKGPTTTSSIPTRRASPASIARRASLT